MIGLEYILQLNGMQHQDLAEKLGIHKQNVNLWIKEKQCISKKFLPYLSDLFGIEESYFQRELDDLDKLYMQKEKIKKDLKPIIIRNDMGLSLGKDADFIDVQIYDREEMNKIELEIEKAIIASDFKNIVSKLDNSIEIQRYKQLNILLSKHGNEESVINTIDGLSHHYDILPDWVTAGAIQYKFIQKFIPFLKYFEKFKGMTEKDIDIDTFD